MIDVTQTITLLKMDICCLRNVWGNFMIARRDRTKQQGSIHMQYISDSHTSLFWNGKGSCLWEKIMTMLLWKCCFPLKKRAIIKVFSFLLPLRNICSILQHRIGFATVCRTTANFTNHLAQEVSLNRNWEILGKKFAWQTLVKYTLLWIKTWPEPLVSPWLI